MELTQITKKIYDASERLGAAGSDIYKLAIEKADTERDYRIALAKEKEILKHDGLSVTLIDDIAKGNVAKIKHKRDLAESKFKASIQAVEAIKAQVNALQSIAKYQSDI